MSSTFEFKAIGTSWKIDIYQDINETEKENLSKKIIHRIDGFDSVYSRFRKDSLVTEISEVAGVYKFPDDSEKLFSLYQELNVITNGLFTPLIGNVLHDAGYDAEYSLTEKDSLKTPPKFNEVLEFNFPNLIVKEPVRLDFGAAGKGYLVDIITKLIQDEGYTDICVDAGGDMSYRTTKEKKLRVGLEDPGNPNQVLGIMEIHNKSLCGSAGNRRVWGRFNHILNPEELSSPNHIIALWVLADTTLLADALTTCLFFVEPEKLKGYTFEYLIVRPDYSIKKSDGFKAELFLS
jgi:thiamine biosynthesis lipoprotein